MLLLFYILAVLMAGGAYFLPGRTAAHLLAGLFMLLQAGVCIYMSLGTGPSSDYFQADAAGLFFLWITAAIGLVSFGHYIIYAQKRGEKERTIRVHQAAFIGFIACVTGALLTDHIGMLWVFLEGTTVTGAVLIYHDRGKLVLEAVWKYVFVCSFSIALAFGGILFLSIGVQETTELDLTFSAVTQAAGQMNTFWLKACFLFILTGFGVKMGTVPMFNVDIDAKDVSPSPVGAMFSSILLNAGFLAIFRFYSAFAHTDLLGWMNSVLTITGLLSVGFAAAFMIRVKNYKRMFAYSSLEHAGLVLVAMTLGPVGMFAAFLHLFFHGLIKAGLFIQIGQVHRTFQSKYDGEAGGYFHLNPAGALVLLFSLVAIVGFPPSGLFRSELIIFTALIQGQKWWIALLLMAFMTLVMYAMGKAILRLLFARGTNYPAQPIVSVSPWEALTQGVGLLVVFAFGIYPPEAFVAWIHQAAHIVPLP